MSSNQTAKTVESLFHSRSFTWNTHINNITYCWGFREFCKCRWDLSGPAFAWSLLNGRVKSPWRSPFFSRNTTLCLLGWRWVLAIKLPEGLENKIWVFLVFKWFFVKYAETEVNQSGLEDKKLWPPAERLLQAVDGLTGRLQDALSVPHSDLPGTSLRTDGTDSKQLTVTSPRYSRPAIVAHSSRLHLLSGNVTQF